MQEKHDHIVRMIRARLQLLLPGLIVGDSLKFETLDLPLSFDSGQRLRIGQHLPADRARAIIEAQVSLIVG